MKLTHWPIFLCAKYRAFLICFACSSAIISAGHAQKSDPSAEEVPREFQAFAPDAGHRGVIDDPDGYVNVRSGKRKDASVVAKVTTGEPFSFKREEGDEWCEVKLGSGKSGWIYYDRIRLFFTKNDLPSKSDEGGEIDKQARKHRVNYYEVAQAAVQGDTGARKKFFEAGQYADGAGAEEHAGVLSVVVHLVGDDALAEFLQSQPVVMQAIVRNSFDENATYPFGSLEYVQRHFPKCAKIFLRHDVTDWPSPDGRYAIHKIFSPEPDYHDSKVTRSEVIDKATRKVLCDFTADDDGKGREREGDILWAQDSNRFAFVSRTSGGKLTAIYQRSGESFVKVNLPLSEAPATAGDPELRDTVFKGEYSPVSMRWTKPNALTFERSYFYKKANNSDSPQSIQRTYEITMTIGTDGKVTAEWKRIKEGE
jgi:hypothetical protein